MTTRIRTAILIDMIYMLARAKKLERFIDPSKMIDALSKMLCFTAQGVVRFDAGTIIERSEVIAFMFNKNDEFNMRQEMELQTSMGLFGLALEQAGITIESLKLHGSSADALIQYYDNIDLCAHSLLAEGKTVLVVGGQRLLEKVANTTATKNLNFLSDERTIAKFPSINSYAFDLNLGVFQDRKRATPHLAYDASREASPQRQSHEAIACCP